MLFFIISHNTYETSSSWVQNAVAKVITGNIKHDHVTPILYDLHWLPIEQRIVFKLLLTCYKALNDVGPLYIKDLLPLAKDKGKGLRSSKDPLLLEDPQTHRATYGDLSFTAAGPREWNNLPLSIRQSPTINSFISALKTRLFKIAYKCQWHLCFFFVFPQYLWTVIHF